MIRRVDTDKLKQGDYVDNLSEDYDDLSDKDAGSIAVALVCVVCIIIVVAVALGVM